MSATLRAEELGCTWSVAPPPLLLPGQRVVCGVVFRKSIMSATSSVSSTGSSGGSLVSQVSAGSAASSSSTAADEDEDGDGDEDEALDGEEQEHVSAGAAVTGIEGLLVWAAEGAGEGGADSTLWMRWGNRLKDDSRGKWHDAEASTPPFQYYKGIPSRPSNITREYPPSLLI